MKKQLLVTGLAIGALVLAGGSAFAGTTIVNTKHDLSAGAPGVNYGDSGEQGGLNRICVYCHAPHNTIAPGSDEAGGVNYLPLWNHEVTFEFYAPYSNGSDEPTPSYTLNDNGTPADPSDDFWEAKTGAQDHQSYAEFILGSAPYQPGGVSRLCLSCHDGSVATNSYGTTTMNADSTGSNDVFINGSGATFSNNQYTIGDSYLGGHGLANHHPIGFNYADAANSDVEIKGATEAVLGDKPVAAVLWNNNMECTTCHDVHDSDNGTAEKFLWISDTKSALCLACHDK